MEKSLLKNTLRELFSDFYETPIPELTRRQIDIPEAPRFATVILGMRRTGKTFLLYQRMNDLLSSGIPKDRILHVNFEDDRLMGITAEDLRYVPEVYYQMYPDNHGGAWSIRPTFRSIFPVLQRNFSPRKSLRQCEADPSKSRISRFPSRSS